MLDELSCHPHRINIILKYIQKYQEVNLRDPERENLQEKNEELVEKRQEALENERKQHKLKVERIVDEIK